MAQRYLIIVSRFNDLVTRPLLEGARDAFSDAGVPAEAVDIVWVPGCFEMPVTAVHGARGGAYRAIVCLGAVIRGDTPHFDYVAGQAASGLMSVSVQTGVPVIFGVLTTETIEQALSRAGLKHGNKGADAARTALAMNGVLSQLDTWSKKK